LTFEAGENFPTTTEAHHKTRPNFGDQNLLILWSHLARKFSDLRGGENAGFVTQERAIVPRRAF